MFEDKTYENLLQDVLDKAPDDIDKRQGSIFYDAVSGVLMKIAKLYTDLDLIFSLTQIDTASGEYLDSRASEFGVVRHEAMKAKYHADFEGAAPKSGERFFWDGMYFVLEYEENRPYFIAEEAGTVANNILPGTAAVPVDAVDGLTSSRFGKISEYGTEAEDDESLRSRLREKISGFGENGNKAHYKRWCESITGVGRARIFPLWNGENTVKAVLISYDGLPCTEDTVDEVQEYIDPGGTGLGEGAANLGAHFTAVKAESKTINVSVTVEIESAANQEDVLNHIKTSLKSYFKMQVMQSSDSEETSIRYSGIGAVISSISGVVDYCDLRLNGSSLNISVDVYSVPVLGVVDIEFIQ